MAGYETIFTVYEGLWPVVGFSLLFWIVGAAGLAASIVWIRRLKVSRFWNKPEGLKPGILLSISIFWLLVTVPSLGINLWLSCRAAAAYMAGDAKMVEGVVCVHREQPAWGRAPGDLIEVNGVSLVVNHDRVTTPGYRKTIAHGGVLSEGAYVRIWYVGREIVRIDLRNG